MDRFRESHFSQPLRVKAFLNILVITIFLVGVVITAGITLAGFPKILPILVLALVGIYLSYNCFVRMWLITPLETIREKAQQIASNEPKYGEQLPLPPMQELRNLTEIVNQLSSNLRHLLDVQEERINQQTQNLAHDRELLQSMLNRTPTGLCLLDIPNNRFVFVNEPMAWFFGTPAAEFLNHGEEYVLRYIHPDDLILYKEMIVGLPNLADEEMAEIRFRVKNCNHSYRWINFHGVVTQKLADGNPHLVLFIAEDVTDAYYAEEKLRYTSTHDMLTGLYNWAFFEEAIKQASQNVSKCDYPTSFIMMDVDNLKVINDSIGHAAGDELLRRIGGILLSSFRDCDVVARVGGDEFAALLPGADAEDLPEILARINHRLREATLVSGVRLDVISIGASTATSPKEVSSARLQADQNMYLDKQRRKCTTV